MKKTSDLLFSEKKPTTPPPTPSTPDDVIEQEAHLLDVVSEAGSGLHAFVVHSISKCHNCDSFTACKDVIWHSAENKSSSMPHLLCLKCCETTVCESCKQPSPRLMRVEAKYLCVPCNDSRLRLTIQKPGTPPLLPRGTSPAKSTADPTGRVGTVSTPMYTPPLAAVGTTAPRMQRNISSLNHHDWVRAQEASSKPATPTTSPSPQSTSPLLKASSSPPSAGLASFSLLAVTSPPASPPISPSSASLQGKRGSQSSSSSSSSSSAFASLFSSHKRIASNTQSAVASSTLPSASSPSPVKAVPIACALVAPLALTAPNMVPNTATRAVSIDLPPANATTSPANLLSGISVAVVRTTNGANHPNGSPRFRISPSGSFKQQKKDRSANTLTSASTASVTATGVAPEQGEDESVNSRPRPTEDDDNDDDYLNISSKISVDGKLEYARRSLDNSISEKHSRSELQIVEIDDVVEQEASYWPAPQN